MLTKEDLLAIAAIMDEKIMASEERTKREMKAYLENTVEKSIQILVEGHQVLNEKIDRILDRVEVAENFEPRLLAVEVKVKENSADIVKLKKA